MPADRRRPPGGRCPGSGGQRTLLRDQFDDAPISGQPLPDRGVTIKGVSVSIVGVVSDDFVFRRYRDVDVWYPARLDAPMRLDLVGKLDPGTTVERAEAVLGELAQQIQPYGLGGPPARVRSVREGTGVDDASATLWALLAGAGLVLSIACANVSSLLLGRGLGRAQETAMRMALGARQSTIAGQAMTDTALLAVGGAALGYLLAIWGLDAVLGLTPGYLPRSDEVAPDLAVAILAIVAAAAATGITGALPALKGANRRNPLAAGSRATGGRPDTRARRALVVAELALATVLLVAVAALARTFLTLWRDDPGFLVEGRSAVFCGFPTGRRTMSTSKGSHWSIGCCWLFDRKRVPRLPWSAPCPSRGMEGRSLPTW